MVFLTQYFFFYWKVQLDAKFIHTGWFNLYEVVEQKELIYDDRTQNRNYLSGDLTGNGNEGLSRVTEMFSILIKVLVI